MTNFFTVTAFWSDWTAWSRCTGNCTVAKRAKSRVCMTSNPHFKCDDIKDVEEEVCQIQDSKCPPETTTTTTAPASTAPAVASNSTAAASSKSGGGDSGSPSSHGGAILGWTVFIVIIAGMGLVGGAIYYKRQRQNSGFTSSILY